MQPALLIAAIIVYLSFIPAEAGFTLRMGISMDNQTFSIFRTDEGVAQLLKFVNNKLKLFDVNIQWTKKDIVNHPIAATSLQQLFDHYNQTFAKSNDRPDFHQVWTVTEFPDSRMRHITNYGAHCDKGHPLGVIALKRKDQGIDRDSVQVVMQSLLMSLGLDQSCPCDGQEDGYKCITDPDSESWVFPESTCLKQVVYEKFNQTTCLIRIPDASMSVSSICGNGVKETKGRREDCECQDLEDYKCMECCFSVACQWNPNATLCPRVTKAPAVQITTSASPTSQPDVGTKPDRPVVAERPVVVIGSSDYGNSPAAIVAGFGVLFVINALACILIYLGVRKSGKRKHKMSHLEEEEPEADHPPEAEPAHGVPVPIITTHEPVITADVGNSEIQSIPSVSLDDQKTGNK